MEKLEFIDENGEKTQFYVIEETRINGINYLLVSESDNEDEEAEAYILKDTSDAAADTVRTASTSSPESVSSRIASDGLSIRS